MIPPTPCADTPMNILTGDDIRHLSDEGMSTEAITCLLVPTDVAAMATNPAMMSS